MKTNAVLVAVFAGALAAAGTVFVQSKPVTYLPSGWKLQPLGQTSQTGNLMAGGELSPDGKWQAFVSVGQGTHSLYIVDQTTGATASKASIPAGWIGMAWSPDSRTVYVSGGTSNSIVPFAVDGAGLATRQDPLKIEGFTGASGWFSGLALVDGKLFIASAASDALLKIDPENGQTLARLDFEPTASPFDVVDGKNGKLYVSLQGSGRIAEIDPGELKETATMPTGAHPNDILVQGDRLFVACGNEDTAEIFDLYTLSREERVNVRPWPDAPAGSTPDALALDAKRQILYVALADNNAVAQIDVSTRGHAHIQGYIPTAHYPCALAVLKDGSLLASAGKGFGTGPNGNTDKIDPVAPQGYPYIVSLMQGTFSLVKPLSQQELASATKSVLALAKYRPNVENQPAGAPKPGSNPIPSRLGDPSPIKHVLYIIKENRTYDQVMGNLTKDGKPYGNGDPKLNLFGEDVAPNHRQLARDFVLLDNFYASGEVSVDGHHWSKGAYVPEFMQRTWPQQYSGKPAPRLSPNLSTPPNGYIWDRVRLSGKSYRTYYYHTTDRANTDWAAARRAGARDYQYVEIFIDEFHKFEREGTMPSFMVMALSEDHTSGTRPGAATPQAAVASNDLGLGKIVEAISKSSLWKEFVIFVVEDDAQNGPDHVDAHRTVCQIISPYTRGRGIDSTHYTTTSILRTISLILGTQPMTQFDAAATPFYNAFRNQLDLTPYLARTPKQDLSAKNPERAPKGIVDTIDFSEPDQMDIRQEQALNRDIWQAVKGDEPYPGTTRRFGQPKRVEDSDGD